MDKACVAAGCEGIPVWGVGTVRGGTVRFACDAHRHLIGWKIEFAGEPPAPAKGEVPVAPKIPGTSPPPLKTAKPGNVDQGSLW